MSPTAIAGVIIAVLVAALAATGYFLKQQIAENGQLQTANEVQAQTIDKLGEDKKKADAALVARDAMIRTQANQVLTLRTKIRALERDNEIVQAWASQPLPRPIIDFLCQLTGSHSEVCVPPTSPAPAAPTSSLDWEYQWRLAGLERGNG